MIPKNNLVILILLLIAFALLMSFAGAVPEPALVPPPGTWQLDFELHGDPQQISLTLPGEYNPRRFWYLLYTVTNKTGQDVEFYPNFEILTDSLKLYQAGDNVRRPVYNAIRDLYPSTIPLLEHEDQVSGKILIGEDNARDSVAIFEDFDPNATHVKIFISGLSNETTTVDYPGGIDLDTGKPKKVLLRKSLMLEYRVPGDQYNPQDRVMLYHSRNWIMR
ncbi:MAG: hypothetical protein JW860_07180 [Sedimentisphaerales bacterium]|nr:hypothetical protein [Sedimentisphaerales bacterium]